MKPILCGLATLAIGLGVAGAKAPPRAQDADRWAWALYESGGSVVLANEVPDTTRLKATLECSPGQDTAALSLYDPGAQPGFARLSAGSATGTAEVRAARGGKMETALRLDHPVFTSFIAQGALSIASGEGRVDLSAGPAFLPVLRQFAQRCAGAGR